MAVNQTYTKTFPSGVATWVRDADDLSGQKISLNNEVTYDVNYCGSYALYYLNSYGGWDSFLIEGKVVRTDNLDNKTYQKFANNNTINFGNNKYEVGITPTYLLSTGYLTDEQAQNLSKNLLSSTKAYLHNLEEDRIAPVIIDATSAEYKTFTNQNHKMFCYTFTVAESQDKIRR